MLTPHHQKASILLAEYIKIYPRPITIIDHLTGGQLQIALQKPNNVQSVSFCQSPKNQSLIFKISGLEQYWQQQSGVREGHASIQCIQNDDIVYQQDAILPFHYRNHPLALLFAAEWCCAKILEILKLTETKKS